MGVGGLGRGQVSGQELMSLDLDMLSCDDAEAPYMMRWGPWALHEMGALGVLFCQPWAEKS